MRVLFWMGMSEDNADLTVRILRGIQAELVGIREDNRGIHAELAGLREDSRGLREDNRGIRQELAGLRDDVHEVRDQIHTIGERIDGVLRIAGTHHDELDRRLNSLEGRVGRLESPH